MILIAVAMASEFEKLISGFQKIDNELTIYEGVISDKNVLILKTGIGKVNSAIAVTKVLSSFDISLVINTGFAGATKDYKVGDEVLITEAYYHDFDLSALGYEKGYIPDFGKSIILKNQLLNDCSKMKQGLLKTGDSFLTKADENESYLCDMEGMAILHVCKLFNKECIIVKIVSDLIGSSSISEYNKFEDSGGLKVNEAIKHLLRRII